MTAVEMARDAALHAADFYRRAAAKGKAGAKGKGARGAVAKGQCGPGGGAPCHKNKGTKALEAKAARSGMLGRMQETSRAAVGASAIAKAGKDVAKARAAIVAAKSAGAAKAGARKAAADEAIGRLETRRAAVRAKGDEARAKLAALDAAKAKGGGGTKSAPAAMKAGAAKSKLSPEKMAVGRKRMDDAFKAAPGADKNRVKASDLAKGMKGIAPADKAAIILQGIKSGKYKIVGKDKAGTDAILARLKARASGASARFSADAEFARAGFYAKKAGAALKASGKKYQKGQTPKGVCGPGGGRACHKNYKAARGTETRKALAAEARAARAAKRGASGATAAARAAAAKEGRGKAVRRMVDKSKLTSEVKKAEVRLRRFKAARVTAGLPATPPPAVPTPKPKAKAKARAKDVSAEPKLSARARRQIEEDRKIAERVAAARKDARSSRGERVGRVLSKAGERIADARSGKAADRAKAAASIKSARKAIAKVDTKQQAKLVEQKARAERRRAQQPRLDLTKGDRAVAVGRMVAASKGAAGAGAAKAEPKAVARAKASSAERSGRIAAKAEKIYSKLVKEEAESAKRFDSLVKTATRLDVKADMMRMEGGKGSRQESRALKRQADEFKAKANKESEHNARIMRRIRSLKARVVPAVRGVARP